MYRISRGSIDGWLAGWLVGRWGQREALMLRNVCESAKNCQSVLFVVFLIERSKNQSCLSLKSQTDPMYIIHHPSRTA